MMITLVRIELYKIFKKWRTYIGFIAIAVLVPVIQIAMMIEGERSLDFMTKNLQQSFIFVGNLLNGYLISYIVLGMLVIHIPFLITLVAGDLLAGLQGAFVHFRGSGVVNPVSEFKGAAGGHLRDGPAEQIDHLLVRMAVAIVHDDPGFQVVPGHGARFFNRLRSWGYRQRGHPLTSRL